MDNNRSPRFARAGLSQAMKRFRDIFLATVVLAGLAWASGCGDGGTEPPPDPPRPATVTVTPTTAELAALGATAQLTAQVLDQYGQVMANATVTWSSSAALVATADGSGLVTAAGNGAATITAMAGSASGTAAVTVMQSVSAVAISPAAATVVERDTLQLVAEATDANGHVVAGAEFSWASGDEAVAIVDAVGLVTGVGAGEVEVTASSSGVAGRAELLVEAPVATAVTVAPDTLEFTALADTVRLMAEVRDQIGRVMEDEPVAWASSDTMLATVDSEGLVTAVGDGSATITATAGFASGTAAVTVMQSVSAVAISPAAATVVERDTLQLVAEATDANGHVVAGAEFSWASGDEAVAIVDAVGLVTGVGAGEVEVTASSSGVAGRAELLVEAPVATAVTVAPDTLEFTALADTVRLMAEVRDQIGRVMEDEPVAWASSDTMLATVDSEGLVTAVGDGSATITATANEASGQALVTVMQSVGSVVVSPPVAMIGTGDTLRLAAEAHDQNGHLAEGTEFTWSSSEVSVATVDRSGVVRGVAEGAATITAAADNVQGTAEITVTNPDRAVLVALYEATDGPNWVNNEGWLSDAPLDEWYGVGTDRFGRVFSLNLQGRWDEEQREWIPHGLQGSIPAAVKSLTSLRYLGLVNIEWLQVGNNNNALTGGIPAELGNLVDLRSLNLGSNALTGSIPTELGNLVNIERLQVGNNSLTGPIPTELGSLAALRSLSLGGNQLTGSIPGELGNLVNLEWLDIGNNSLTGPIPTELGSLTALRSLSLGGNQLTGSIPPELGSLANLESLSLGWNALSGPMPRSLLQLVNLTWLYFDSNDGLCAPGTAGFATWLEGIEWSEGPFCNEADREALELLFETGGGSGWTKSDGWRTTPVLEEWHGVEADSLGRVETLDLTRNGLQGELTPAVGSLADMTRLRLGGNALSGRLPLSLARLSLVEFHYDDTELCAPTEDSFRAWLNSIASHQGTGLECLSVRGVLKTFYEATDGPNWVNSDGWLTDAPLDEWYGVDIDGFGRVVGLNLQGQWDEERREWIPHGLQGSIPAQLGSLTDLRHLLLDNNALAGGIPPELGNLVDLMSLNLGSNALTGSIPTELGNLVNIEWLQVGNNTLTGPIPTELGSLAALRSLSLRGNQLTGSIPGELGNLVDLRSLNLGSNALAGGIPPELGNLVDLRSLNLGSNALTGSIPTELGNLVNLEWLDIGNNSLTGPIPTELGSLAALRSLSLGGNQLTGSIPGELGNLVNLEWLDIGNNSLTGPIPTELGSLAALRSLSLGGNQLTGSIPGELGNLVNLEWLDIGNNSLTGPIPTELGSLTALRSLSLGGNQLTGSIPPELGSLANLESLSLGWNALSDPMPRSLLQLVNLTWLYFDSNDGLCAPGTAGFATWLEGIERSEGPFCNEADKEALELLFETGGGSGWTKSDGWRTTPVLEEWHGVEADSLGRVETLDLTRNGLQGELTPAVGSLADMTRLRLGGNALSGRLPLSLARLSLVEFHYDDTELCAPTEDSFRAWLNSIASHQGTGLECLSVRGVLKTFYEATDGPNWVNSDGWLTDAPLDEWYGVDIDGFGRVVGLNLRGQWDEERREWIPHGLQGSIPAQLGSLTDLRHLLLDNNALAGGIPPELGNLVDLRSLNLGSNALTGSIPTELGNLVNIERLQVGNNTLTGPIPTELGSLAALRSLSLGGNQLTGSIPGELGNLVNLEWLDIGNNSLTGPIPTELGSLTALRSLSLGGNQLTGSIPTELGNLVNIERLQVGNNSLTGPIPTELGSLAALRSLSLGGNELTGSIPPELGSLTNLESLSLGWNALSGPMPRSLLQLVNLTWLYFDSNDGLCAPGTAGFATWLEGIERSEGPFCNEADREALELLFETGGGSGWTRSDRWLDTQALAEWHGVTADTLGRVSALDLGGNGLAGKVPPWSRGALAQLTELRIGENADLAGRLPLSLAELSLRVLHYAGTGVCAPADEAFARWLNSIASHVGTGLECAPLSDREILEIVYGATGGPDWTNSENWLTDRPLSEWHRVEVDRRGRVVGLSLTFNRLTGSIPPELGRLTELQSLSLGGFSYALTGTIPPELGNLANLRSLSLFQTGLKGGIPSQLGDLANLEWLSVGYNELAGSIPPELGNLGNLRSLHLDENKLTGAIPGELGDLAKLHRLSLVGNELAGSIPARLGDLGNLNELSLGRNRLTGSLPVELASLSNLEGIYLGHNDLTGAVPREFGGLTGLRALALSGNIDMSGALPSSLINLRSLETLAASGTQLCAPSDPRFLEWLDQLPGQRVVRCGTAPAMAYLVQSVQSRDFPVPLVAGKEALLRVFVTAARDNEERLPPVRASFHLNGALAHVADLPGKPGPIPTDVDEGSLAGSANAVIPGEVVQPGLEMVIEVDPDETLDPTLGVARRIPETGRLAVDVRATPVLDLTVIPFLWATSPDSAILEHTAGMAADPDGHELLAETRVLLPVGSLQVTAHDPVLTSSNNVFALLRETDAIRAIEGGGGHWKGMMSGPITGAGGVAYLPGRVSFSAPSVGTIAHELGHNMNLPHAPCGGAGGPDPAFPYGDGSIGAWGFDLDRGTLVRPSRPDLMSYCGPEWVSDYNFSKALRFRLADEGDASPAMVSAPAPSLLLWGGVDSTGTPFLEPAFAVNAPSALPASAGEFTINGRDGGGGGLFSLRFAMPVVADGDGSSSFAFILPVQPGWQSDLASIALSGPGGSATLDGDTDVVMAILRNPRTGQVRAFLRDLPPRIQAAMDVVGRAAGPGLEVFFSRGIPGAEAWRR